MRDLVTESKYIKREFGESLPTFKGVMEKHQVNKLKEDWWSNMSAKQRAAYIKAHPKSQQAQDATDDTAGDPDDSWDDEEGRAKPTGKTDADIDDYDYDMGEPDDKPFGGDTGKDADYDYETGEFTGDDEFALSGTDTDDPAGGRGDAWMHGDEEPKEKRPGGKQAEDDYQKADQMMKKYAGVDIEKAEYWAKKKREASDKMMGRTGKELGEDKMDESVKMHAISGNKRFMTKTAIPILKKYGIKNMKAHNIGGYFLELRFAIDSNKLKELDKELKRKNKTAYGGIVETRRDKMKEDVLRKVIREEIKKMIKEDEEAFSQPIPAQIDRYMKKFIDAVSRGNLNRKRKLAILGRTIVALQLDPQEVSKYARLVKREL